MKTGSAHQPRRSQSSKVVKVDYVNYKHLYPEGREIIEGCFGKAWHKRKCRDDKSFEPFIWCWIAFNSWAACVTGEDSDRVIIDSLKADKTLSSGFETLLKRNCSFNDLAQDFRRWWPIFKAQELRRLNVRGPRSNDRRQVVEYYFEAGASKYEPKDLGNSFRVGDDIPLSWGNTLEAAYRVRCNLFHGDKRLSSEANQQIVGCAFRVLANFFQYCLRAPRTFNEL
jgi:hypothetical protein